MSPDELEGMGVERLHVDVCGQAHVLRPRVRRQVGGADLEVQVVGPGLDPGHPIRVAHRTMRWMQLTTSFSSTSMVWQWAYMDQTR